MRRSQRIGHAHHAPTLGSEQRLDDHVAPKSGESLQGGVGVLADHGGRHGQAGRLEQGRRQILVHTGFDGTRGIEDDDAASLQPMQQVHAKDDLLQRAGRHGPHQHAIKGSERIGSDGNPGGNAAEIDGDGFVAK